LGHYCIAVGSVITTYVNKYYEKTGAVVTTNYYFGGKLIAVRKNAILSYIMQDSLGSTSGTVNSTTGARDSTITYCPFGSTRFTTGTLPTDMKFTGQRQESTGLYYYGARYYDPVIGRFISADTIVPNFANPQSLNRYSYCLNNPLKYTDSNGHFAILAALGIGAAIGAAVGAVLGAVVYALKIDNTDEAFSWGGLGKAVVTGGVTGALAALAPIAGAGILGTAIAAGMAGAVGYIAGESTESAIYNASNTTDPTPMTGEGVAIAMALGYISGGMGYLISAAIAPALPLLNTGSITGGAIAVSRSIISGVVKNDIQNALNSYSSNPDDFSPVQGYYVDAQTGTITIPAPTLEQAQANLLALEI
jgi:RHS repeat-associated protein